jgi:hypothetical protein
MTRESIQGAIMLHRNILITAISLAFAMTLTGCGSQKGKTIFTASPNSGTVVGVAPDSGTYLLFTSLSPNPIMTIHLNQGDKLGFQKAADGRIEAVYLDKTYDLNKDTAQAYWKLQE